MNEGLERQLKTLEGVIRAYRDEQITLNTLIQRIEGIAEFIDTPSCKEEIFPILLVLEQINAVNLDTKAQLSASQKADIKSALQDVDSLINRFSKEPSP